MVPPEARRATVVEAQEGESPIEPCLRIREEAIRLVGLWAPAFFVLASSMVTVEQSPVA